MTAVTTLANFQGICRDIGSVGLFNRLMAWIFHRKRDNGAMNSLRRTTQN